MQPGRQAGILTPEGCMEFQATTHLLWEAAACDGGVNISTIQDFHRILCLLNHLPELSLNGFQAGLQG